MSILPKDTLRKEYQIRIPVKGRKSLIVTMPYEVIEREARRRGLPVKKFLAKYQAIAQYDSFDGVFYSFEERPSEGEQPKGMAPEGSKEV